MREELPFVNFLQTHRHPPTTQADFFPQLLVENFDSQSRPVRGYGPAMNAPVRCGDDELKPSGQGGRR
jgi:hypothetical protein